jgi:histidinol phosphatase-like PHP family hydrolase
MVFEEGHGMASVDTVDWHVHYFRDGCAEPEMTVESILGAAAEKDVEAIGLLGHFRNRMVIQDLAYWIDPNPKFFDFLRHDLEAQPSIDGGLKTHIGAEVDINTLEGEVSITAEQASQIDFVMAGIHWPPTLPPQVDYIDLQEPAQLVEAYCSYNKIQAAEFNVERLVCDILRSITNAVSRNPFINILAHPTAFAIRLGPLCIDMKASNYYDELAAALAANGVAYELNDATLADYPSEVLERFVIPLIQRCAEAGAAFTIGSDAHRIKDVGELGLALRLKEKLGIPDTQFVTSLEMFSEKEA